MNRSLLRMAQLYGTHRPTNLAQKVMLTAGSALGAILNPMRGDMVATLGETTGTCALQSMRKQMLNHPVGRQILFERPLITNANMNVNDLLKHEEGTLGRCYGEYMAAHGFDADGRSPVHFVDDEELAYVMLRYRQTHDYFHALLGLPPTELAELGLKVLEGLQTGLPMNYLAVLFGSLRLSREEHRFLFTEYVPWAYKTAGTGVLFLNVYWEKELGTQVDDLRAQMQISKPPEFPPYILANEATLRGGATGPNS